MLETFAIFGGAFVARPLGGILFGHIGDGDAKHGRSRALQGALFCIALPTLSIGLLPGYERLGPASPLLLTMFRLLQGVAVGGQLVGSLTTVCEAAPPEHRHFYGACVLSTSVAGLILGSAVGAVMRMCISQEQLSRGLWRAPFLAGILLALPGILLQRALAHGRPSDGQTIHTAAGTETAQAAHELSAKADAGPEGGAELTAAAPQSALNVEDGVRKNEAELEAMGTVELGVIGGRETTTTRDDVIDKQPAPLLVVLRGHKQQVLLTVMVVACWASTYWIVFSWSTTMALDPGLGRAPIRGAPLINAIALVYFCAVLLFAGAALDRPRLVGFRHALRTRGALAASALLIAFCAPPAFMVIDRGPMSYALACFALATLTGMYAAPLGAYFTSSFPPEVRYTGLALGYNFAQAIFGGLASLFATMLYRWYGPVAIGCCISAVALAAAVPLLMTDCSAHTGAADIKPDSDPAKIAGLLAASHSAVPTGIGMRLAQAPLRT